MKDYEFGLCPVLFWCSNRLLVPVVGVFSTKLVYGCNASRIVQALRGVVAIALLGLLVYMVVDPMEGYATPLLVVCCVASFSATAVQWFKKVDGSCTRKSPAAQEEADDFELMPLTDGGGGKTEVESRQEVEPLTVQSIGNSLKRSPPAALENKSSHTLEDSPIWLVFCRLVMAILGYHSSQQRMHRRVFWAHFILSLLFATVICWVYILAAEPVSGYHAVEGLPMARCMGEFSAAHFRNSTLTTRFNMEEYSKLHHRILHEYPPERRRFLVYEARNFGLGNRILGLVSAFLTAMATERALLVNWPKRPASYAELDDLFQNPGFDWNSASAWQSLAETEKVSAPSSYGYYLSYCRLCALRGFQDENKRYEKLLCDGDAGIPEQDAIVRICSTQWFGPVLAHNPYFRGSICAGISETDLFGTLARFLLRPIKLIQDRIDAFRKKYFDSGHRVVALQVRAKENYRLSPNQISAFFSCAYSVSEQLLGSLPRNSVALSSNTTHAGHDILPSTPLRPGERISLNRMGGKDVPSSRQSGIKWFVATDSLDVRQRLRDMLEDDLLVWETPAGEGKVISKGTVSGVQDALTEMWLLGEADEIVVSPYSTFGYVAHARVGKIPHTVLESLHCVRFQSGQPCFQKWFHVPTMGKRCWQDNMQTPEMINQHECFF